VSKPFTKTACIQTIKAKQSPYYTHAHENENEEQLKGFAGRI